MNLLTKTLNKIFKSGNQQQLDKIKPLIVQINNQESHIKSLKDNEFKEKTYLLKKSIQEGRDLNSIIPESFALVREAAKRVLGERHYDVQLAGGIILHNGKIAEMKTGEGKTLVSTLPAYLNSLTGKGVHIVTVNDYLARRDADHPGRGTASRPRQRPPQSARAQSEARTSRPRLRRETRPSKTWSGATERTWICHL